MIIDSHHHYWDYNSEEYDWIDDKMSIIRRNFLPENLASTIEMSGVDGVVTVQARQVVDETDWLLKLASQNPFMKGVVGWLPIVTDDFESLLEAYASNNKLKALRHVIQGEADDQYILGDQFNRGVSLLKKYDLAYDILILEKHLPQTIQFVDKHPNQLFVLDHIAKPLIATGELSPWKENMIELAKRENVYCKLSGMVTEADFSNWTEEQLQPYFDVVLSAFQPSRLMFGSDWPVCLVGVDYDNWLQLVRKSISSFSKDEQALILGRNAIKAYNL